MSSHRLHLRAANSLAAAIDHLRDASANLHAAIGAERAEADPSEQRAIGALRSLVDQVDRAVGAAVTVRNAYAADEQ